MPGKPPDSVESSRPNTLGLSSLECLGAYFTSQMHDLNNLMAVITNSSLLMPKETSISPAMTEFLKSLFGTLDRLSATSEQFNAVRKIYPVAVEKVSLSEAMEVLTGAVSDCNGWSVAGKIDGNWQVSLNPVWLHLIIPQLIAHMQVERGTVEISIGELPPRQYKHSLRSTYSQEAPRALLVHFQGENSASRLPANERPVTYDFQIALELVRLLGAGISLSRSDSPQDYLLAFRLQPWSP